MGIFASFKMFIQKDPSGAVSIGTTEHPVCVRACLYTHKEGSLRPVKRFVLFAAALNLFEAHLTKSQLSVGMGPSSSRTDREND